VREIDPATLVRIQYYYGENQHRQPGPE